MTQPNPPPTGQVPQVPLAAQIAALVPQPVSQQPIVPPSSVLPQPQPQPQLPYAVIVTDGNGIEHPVAVIRAALHLKRDGLESPKGSIELEAQVHNRPDVPSLLSVANMTGQYTITLRYFGRDGTIIRNDKITVNATSRADYMGPQLSADTDTWSFVESLTIHA